MCPTQTCLNEDLIYETIGIRGNDTCLRSIFFGSHASILQSGNEHPNRFQDRIRDVLRHKTV